jgi:AcrR family transcriptional regulator
MPQSSTPAPQPSKTSRGRPRDPGIETRALKAAQRVYGRVGLAGFTFDAVAAESGIGKPALYRRWMSKEDLLRDALVAYSVVIDESVHPDLRSQLHEVVYTALTLPLSEEGMALTRLNVESRGNPEALGAYRSQLIDTTHAKTTGLVARAIERGEIPGDTDPDLVIELLTGAAFIHAVRTRPDRIEEARAEAHKYCDRVVDFVMRAIGAVAPGQSGVGA